MLRIGPTPLDGGKKDALVLLEFEGIPGNGFDEDFPATLEGVLSHEEWSMAIGKLNEVINAYAIGDEMRNNIAICTCLCTACLSCVWLVSEFNKQARKLEDVFEELNGRLAERRVRLGLSTTHNVTQPRTDGKPVNEVKRRQLLVWLPRAEGEEVEVPLPTKSATTTTTAAPSPQAMQRADGHDAEAKSRQVAQDSSNRIATHTEAAKLNGIYFGCLCPGLCLPIPFACSIYQAESVDDNRLRARGVSFGLNAIPCPFEEYRVRRPLGPHFNSPNVWYHETSKEEPPCLYDDDECGGYGGDCAQGFFGACGARICYMNCSKFVCCCMCSRLITRCCAACPSPIVSSGLRTPAFPWRCCDSVYTLCSEECRPIVCCPCICFGSLEGPSGGGNQPGATFGAGWGETTHKPFGHQM